MKKEMLKRVLALTLAFLVAFVGMPINAMAIESAPTVSVNLQTEPNLNGLLSPIDVVEEPSGEAEEPAEAVPPEVVPPEVVPPEVVPPEVVPPEVVPPEVAPPEVVPPEVVPPEVVPPEVVPPEVVPPEVVPPEVVPPEVVPPEVVPPEVVPPEVVPPEVVPPEVVPPEVVPPEVVPPEVVPPEVVPPVLPEGVIENTAVKVEETVVVGVVDSSKPQIAVDDFFKLYIDGGIKNGKIIEPNLQVTSGNAYSNPRDLPPDVNSETVFAVKAWDRNKGNATIAGMYMQYPDAFTGKMTGTDGDWYIFIGQKPSLDSEGRDWTDPYYKGSWSNAHEITNPDNYWVDSHNDEIKWIWHSDYYEEPFTETVYFRNIMNKNVPPEISKTDFLEVVQYDVINLLTGASATDEEDGDITGNIEVYVTAPDENEEKIVTPDAYKALKAGVYQVRYTVTDSGKDSATVTKSFDAILAPTFEYTDYTGEQALEHTYKGFDLKSDVTVLNANADQQFTVTIQTGDELKANYLDVRLPGEYVVLYSTEYKGRTFTDTRTIEVIKSGTDDFDYGLIGSVTNSVGRHEIGASYDYLVLLAQMQTMGKNSAANLRNSIQVDRKGRDQVDDLRNQNYQIEKTHFTTYVEEADGTKNSDESVGFFAMESGYLYNGPKLIAESGTFIIDYNRGVDPGTSDPEWYKIDIQKSFNNPVVIAHLASVNGGQYTHARLKEENGDYYVWLEEWDEHRDTNSHYPELISYVVFEEGLHVLDDNQVIYVKNGLDNGTQIYNGTIDLGEGSSRDLKLNYDDYVVLSQVQNYNDQDQVWVRQFNKTFESVDLLAQEEFEGSHVLSDIGMVIIGKLSEMQGPEITMPESTTFRGEFTLDFEISDDSGIRSFRIDEGESVEGNLETDIQSFEDPMNDEDPNNDDAPKSLKFKDTRTVTITAVDRYGNESSLSKVYTADNEAPSIEFDPKGVEGAPVKFSGTQSVDILFGEDAKVKKYRKSLDEEWKEYSDATEIDLIATTTVYAYAEDELGNNVTEEQIYELDREVPDLTVTPGTSYFISELLVTLTSTYEDASILISYVDPEENEEAWQALDGSTLLLTNTTTLWAKSIRPVTDETGRPYQSPVVKGTYTEINDVMIIDPEVRDVELEKVDLKYGYSGTTPLDNDLRDMDLDYQLRLTGLVEMATTRISLPYSVNRVIWYTHKEMIAYDEPNDDQINQAVTDENDYIEFEGYRYYTSNDIVSLDGSMVYGKEAGDSKVHVDVFLLHKQESSVTVPDEEVQLTSVSMPEYVVLSDDVAVNVSYSAYYNPSDDDDDDDVEPSSPQPEITIELDADVVTLDFTPGEDSDDSVDLNAIIRNTRDKRTRWEITNNPYLEIDGNGTITFKSTPPEGIEDFSATVTATSLAGDVSATARVLLNELVPEAAISFFNPYVYGYPDNTFRPENAVTRAEVATMFATILEMNLDYPGTPKFNDVAEGEWYYNYIQAIARTNIFVGDDLGNFNPDAPITRAELSTVFAKFWQYKNVDVNKQKVMLSDVAENHWASQYIYMMYNAGIVSTLDNGSYAPEMDTLRRDVVAMINKLIERPENQAIASKFLDVEKETHNYGNIEAAAQPFIRQADGPVDQ